uniref:DNA-directed DNA polymerase n=1 Tax=Sinocyclocheilus grahami TaxID=75366 RepID=A0A672KQZ0_SINGR
MSTERTFGVMSDPEEQYSLCRDLCHDLAQDLLWEGLKGKTVTLKLKNVKFEGKTRAFTVQYAVYTEGEIFAAAKDLLKVEIDSVSPQPLKLRLMGIYITPHLIAEVFIHFFYISVCVYVCMYITSTRIHLFNTLKSSSHDPSYNEEKPSTSISGPVEETDDGSDFKTPFFRTKINGKRSVIHKKKMPLSESSSKASQTTNSLEAVTEISSASKGLSLMCPVCSQPQSTDDLALFNRHVDMCLNQEVLLEFRESHAPVDHSDSALKGVRGQCRNEKMQGSSPLPPSKEIKVLSTKHTIDKFFKDNTRQNI